MERALLYIHLQLKWEAGEVSTPLHLQQAPWFISGWLLLRPRPAIPLHLLLLSPSREGPWSSCPPSSRGPSGAQPSPSTSLKGPGHPLNKPLSGIALHPSTPTTLPPLPQPVAQLSPTPLKTSRRHHFPPQLPGSLVVPSVCGPCQLPSSSGACHPLSSWGLCRFTSARAI